MFYKMDHDCLMSMTSTSWMLFIEVEVLGKNAAAFSKPYNWGIARSFLGTILGHSTLVLDGRKQQGFGYIRLFFWQWNSFILDVLNGNSIALPLYLPNLMEEKIQS